MANSSQLTLSLIHVWRVIEIPHGPTQTQRKTQNHNPCLWSMWKRAILSENSWTAQAFVPSYHRCYRIYVRILRIFYPFIEEITNSQIVSTWIWKAQTVSALWFQITVQSENSKTYWSTAPGTWGKTVFLWSMWQRSVNFRLTFLLSWIFQKKLFCSGI